jgi:bifunctional non-homologous end joining protein LigD
MSETARARDEGRIEDLAIEGRRIRLTNLDRVLWPRTGFTKADMIAHYRSVAANLVPYLAGRPLTLGRFPMGVDGPGWAQTECRGRPPWLRTAPVRLKGGRLRHYCLVEDEASLVWVANQGSIELHPFLWRVTDPERPTEIVFDLDPGPGTGLSQACLVAVWLRELLAGHGLDAWAKTTGSAGVHVHVPLEQRTTFEATKAFARAAAARLAREHPDLVLDRMARSLRDGRVFVDWAQNGPRRSLIAPWSLRATPVPAVATPLGWDEVTAHSIPSAS